jgi:alpha-L-rhamnosidase
MAARSVLLATIVTAVLLGSFMAIQAQARPIFQASGLTPENPRCEYLVNPLGIGTTEPRLSWTVESNQRGQVQTAYRILVASNLKLLGKDTGDLWDSGKVMSNHSNQIVYQGAPLKSQMRCYWKVCVWDKQGQPSAWSERAYWTMGLLDPNDWKGKWISFDASRKRDAQTRKVDLTKAKWIWYPEADTSGGAPVGTRFFRTEFVLPEGRQLVAAPCAVTADNSFKMFLNGRRIRNGNNFKQAVEADVKEHLLPGRNVLAVEAKNEGDAPNPAGLIAILSLHFADGQSVNVISDETWHTSETGDAGWMNADFDAGKWPRARVVGAYGAAPWGDISVAPGDLFLPPAQLLRKQFVLEKRIERATVYASALGNYELHINGRRVGDAYFTPGWTD